MFSFFSNLKDKINREESSGRAVKNPFSNKDASRLDVLIRTRGDWDDKKKMTNLLEAIKKDFGMENDDKVDIVSKDYHEENPTTSLQLPCFQMLGFFPPRRTYSRMFNKYSEEWRQGIHEDADCFVYYIDLQNISADEYLNGIENSSCEYPAWEGDRHSIASFLVLVKVFYAPRKPLLLLVSRNDETTGDLDMDCLVNLLDLASLRRPFRAVLYDSRDNDAALKEAFTWLKNACCSDDETTAKMTGNETGEDEDSVVTADRNDHALKEAFTWLKYACCSDDETTAKMTGNETGEDEDSVVTADQDDQNSRYILDYEPTLLGGNATLQRFRPIQRGTHCPFARAAKLWGGKLPSGHGQRLPGGLSAVEEAAALNAGPLAEFAARSSCGESLDGFCLEIPNARGARVEFLGQAIRNLLMNLANHDPSGENAFKMGPVDSPDWRFRFAGEDFFLTSFSSCYGSDSSRYTFGVNRAFLLFQPLTSFGRHGLIKDTPASATDWENPTSMRDKARVAFKRNGCPYHIPEELPYPVAEHVVKPLVDDGKTVVRWWNAIRPEDYYQLATK